MNIFDDVLRYCFDGERDPLTLERTEIEYEFLRGDCPLIQEAAKKFDYRAFFETGINESDRLDDDLRAATVLDAVISGYSMNDLVRWYIYHKDFSPYRLGGVDSCIDSQLRSLIKYLRGKAVTDEQRIQVRDCFRPFEGQETHNVYEAAARYDQIVTSLMREQWTLGALREYQYSFLFAGAQILIHRLSLNRPKVRCLSIRGSPSISRSSLPHIAMLYS